jgi:hypothetical protein
LATNANNSIASNPVSSTALPVTYTAKPAVADKKKFVGELTSTLTSFFASSPFDSSIYPIKAAVTEYLAARTKYIGNDLQAKLDRITFGRSDEKLTPAEKKTIDGFYRAGAASKLSLMAKTLFLSAYDQASGTLDPNKQGSLKLLLEVCVVYGIKSKIIEQITGVASKDLLPADRKMAVELLLFGGGKDAGKKAVVKRIAEADKKTIFNYDGIHDRSASADGKSVSALRLVVTSELDGWLEERVADMVLADPRSQKLLYSDNELHGQLDDLSIVLRYMRTNGVDRKSEEAYNQEIKSIIIYMNRLKARSYEAPVGSKEKITASNEARLLGNFLMQMNVAQTTITAYEMILNIPFYNKIDYQGYMDRSVAFSDAASPLCKADRAKMRPFFINKLKEMVHEINLTNDQEKKCALITILHLYSQYLASFSVTIQEYTDILRGVNASGLGRQLTMQDLKDHKLMFIRPQDLPLSVIDNLRLVGSWETISRLPFIILTHNIGLSILDKMGSFRAAGTAQCGIIVTLDTYDESIEDVPSAEELAQVLAHEGAHVKWFIRNFRDETLLKSTLDERNAFLTGMFATVTMLRGLQERHLRSNEEVDAKMVSLSYVLAQTRIAVMNANKVLGYPALDLTYRWDIKDPEIDMDVYPSLAFKDIDGEEMGMYLKDLRIDSDQGFIDTITGKELTIKVKSNGAKDRKKFSVTSVDIVGLDEKYKGMFMKMLEAIYIRDGSVKSEEKGLGSKLLFSLMLSSSNEPDEDFDQKLWDACLKKARSLDPKTDDKTELLRLAKEHSSTELECSYLMAAFEEVRGLYEIKFSLVREKLFLMLKYQIYSDAFMGNIRAGKAPFEGAW